jgi:hypothetical protein
MLKSLTAPQKARKGKSSRYSCFPKKIMIKEVCSQWLLRPKPALNRIVFHAASKNHQNPTSGPFVVRPKRARPSMAQKLLALPGLDI